MAHWENGETGLENGAHSFDPVDNSHVDTSDDVIIVWISTGFGVLVLTFCCWLWKFGGAEFIQRGGGRSDRIFAERRLERRWAEEERKRDTPEERRAKLLASFERNNMIKVLQASFFRQNSEILEVDRGDGSESRTDPLLSDEKFVLVENGIVDPFLGEKKVVVEDLDVTLSDRKSPIIGENESLTNGQMFIGEEDSLSSAQKCVVDVGSCSSGQKVVMKDEGSCSSAHKCVMKDEGSCSSAQKPSIVKDEGSLMSSSSAQKSSVGGGASPDRRAFLGDCDSSSCGQRLFLETENGVLVVPSLCAICLGSYEIDERVVVSSNPLCSHVFHKECILEWLVKMRDGTPCPCCRQEFTTDLNDNDELGPKDAFSFPISF